MAKGDIIKAYAEWHDPESCFAVFLEREDEDGYEDLDNAKPLRQFHRCVDIMEEVKRAQKDDSR